MFIAEIDPSQIATLTGLTSTGAILQLVAGGDAVLAVPSAPLITGKILRLEVAGVLHSALHNSSVQLYFGDSTSNPLNISSSTSSPGQTIPFAWEYDFCYDSTTQTLFQPAGPQITSTGVTISVSTQTGIKFVLVANTNAASDPSAYVTITGFRLKTI